ncbi:helix-hairpin-helix domain-containing protein [Haloflavibacter putidus]|uniref:Helix-hairpin-helix domain-containing protein n=2 Tax=Haloflavibacter putidus TaxID=2576776 RepID=A0A507ZQC5_9FLAO|nr:helix-hairpin-helix domain-containing protein [Haloflavibacter putidus]
MSFNKSHLIFTKSQRNGIFFMSLIILVLLGGMFWVNKQAPENTLTKDQEKEFLAVQKELDSLKKLQLKKQKKTYKIYPFNPNFITDYKGYTLGMSTEEIDRLHAFREKDQWINSKKDFQNVTEISDSLLNKIAPYFKFPDWVVAQNKTKKQQKQQVKALPYAKKTDLNQATSAQLQEINGIGEKIALRILRYRNKLDGFVADIQIKDIYGLKYETEEKLLARFTVKTPPSVEVLDLNKATLIQLSEIPYFNYELAREIINYRELHEGIKTFEELAKIEDFPAYKIERIKLYVQIK